MKKIERVREIEKRERERERTAESLCTNVLPTACSNRVHVLTCITREVYSFSDVTSLSL